MTPSSVTIAGLDSTRLLVAPGLLAPGCIDFTVPVPPGTDGVPVVVQGPEAARGGASVRVSAPAIASGGQLFELEQLTFAINTPGETLTTRGSACPHLITSTQQIRAGGPAFEVSVTPARLSPRARAGTGAVLRILPATATSPIGADDGGVSLRLFPPVPVTVTPAGPDVAAIVRLFVSVLLTRR